MDRARKQICHQGARDTPWRANRRYLRFVTACVAVAVAGTVVNPVATFAMPGRIAVTDSIPPAADLAVPFGNVPVGLVRRAQVMVSNTDPANDLVVSGIAFGSLVEDFADGLAQDWDAMPDAFWSVSGGEYRAQAGELDRTMQSVYTGASWQDPAASTRMRRTGDVSAAACLFVRASADFNWRTNAGSAYGVGISGDGFYAVSKWADGTWRWLQPWTGTPHLNQGELTNEVAFQVQGTTLAVFFNGTLTWSGTDSSVPGPGWVGVGGYSGADYEAVHYFDNVTVAEASGSAAPDALSRSRAAFRLENVPPLPVTIAPDQSVTFDAVYAPHSYGAHEAAVAIASSDPDHATCEVKLSGTGVMDDLRVAPDTAFVCAGHRRGSFTPAAMEYRLSNAGAVALSWTAAPTAAARVNVTPATGTLGPGETAVVTVVPAATVAALPDGTYADSVTFSDTTSGWTTPRTVMLTVCTSPQIAVTPPMLTATLRLGGATVQPLTVANLPAGDGDLEFRAAARETGRTAVVHAAGSPPPAGPEAANAAATAGCAPDRLLVRFAADVKGARRQALLDDLGPAQIVQEYALVPGLCLVTLPAGETVPTALSRFSRTAGVLSVQPDYRVRVNATAPNDARFAEQWGMHNTGQTGGTPGADIAAPAAWDQRTTAPEVIVAVIDTGVDYRHEDLAANMWTNPGEIPGDGIDNDGNGFVDDVHGYDFVNHDGDPLDDHNHGTHCAGTIGAAGNNGVGVVGVCWRVRIMALKFLDADGEGWSSDAISCIEYATRMGARILSNSWGGDSYDQALKNAIDAAGVAGAVFVAAAGNANTNNDVSPYYPASYDSANLIAVMATDAHDRKSSFSCYGATSVDLGAPGSTILSCKRGGGYAVSSGTSMATPHVAGACALLLGAAPGLSVAAVKNALLTTVDPTLSGLCVSGGRLNVAAALAALNASWLTPAPAAGTGLAPGTGLDLAVQFAAGDLGAGAYTGEIVIDSNDLVAPQVTVPVTLTILSDDLEVSPAGPFAAAGDRGGPYAPACHNISLTNTGTAPLTWTAAAAQPWLTVTPATGTLAVSTGAALTVTLTAAAHVLPPGTYTDALVVTNVGSGAVQRRAVSLEVRAVAPTAPGSPRATGIGTDSITWNWTDHSDDETGFKVYAGPGAAAPGTVTYTTAAEAEAWPHTGLEPNTQYAFQVAATNGFGDSDKTANLTAWSLAGTPLGPLVGNPTPDTLTVGIDTDDRNPAGTEYAIRITPPAGGDDWVQTGGAIGGVPAWQPAAAWGATPVIGLTAGTVYAFAAKARNGTGVETTLGPDTGGVISARLTIALVTGWNWISFNVIPADNRLEAMLASYGPRNGDQFKSQTAIANRAGGKWWPAGNLVHGIQPGAMYLLKVTGTPSPLVVTGSVVNPNTAIPLVQGWNWIGFTGQTATQINPALANFAGAVTANDQLKSQSEFATCTSAVWHPASFQLQPGMGYKLKVQKASPAPLIFGH